MKLLTISNLYPRPDQPGRGLFNRQLFDELARRVDLDNVCLVPEWRAWRWPAIHAWRSPIATGIPTAYMPVAYLPVVGRGFSARTYAWSMRAVSERAGDVDAIFASWLYPDGVAAARIAATARRPAWLMALGSDTFHLGHALRRRRIREACRTAEGVVCVCRLLADRLVAAGVERGKVHVVPNGVDRARFHHTPRADARAALAERCVDAGWLTRRDVPVVLFVGNLVPVKGPDVAVEAFAALLHQARVGPLPHLVVLGDGPMRNRLRRLCGDYGLGDRVQLLGRVAHGDLPLWMNAADVLCLTSRGEGMPNVVLEALACGLPIVASDVGACREMLNGEAAARVVPAEAPAATAAAMENLIETGCDREALAARHGRRSWGDQAVEILALIEAHGGV